MSRTFKLVAAALAASVMLAPAALAQTAEKPAKPVSMRVAYGDLDMSRPASGVSLLKRIEGAARKVCNDVVTHTPMTPHAMGACRNETVASTVRALNIGTLTAAWSGAYPSTTLASR